MLGFNSEFDEAGIVHVHITAFSLHLFTLTLSLQRQDTITIRTSDLYARFAHSWGLPLVCETSTAPSAARDTAISLCLCCIPSSLSTLQEYEPHSREFNLCGTL